MTKSKCPKCQKEVDGVFPSACPSCGFTIDALAGRGTSDFQKMKIEKHADLLYGRDIRLSKADNYNASFDFNGIAKLEDLIRFAITFGDRTTVKGRQHDNPIILCYTPEIIGSGTGQSFKPGMVACSGIILMSPASADYAHSFPVLDAYAAKTFSQQKSNCRRCSKATPFGVPLCADCQKRHCFDWQKMLENGI